MARFTVLREAKLPTEYPLSQTIKIYGKLLALMLIIALVNYVILWGFLYPMSILRLAFIIFALFSLGFLVDRLFFAPVRVQKQKRSEVLPLPPEAYSGLWLDVQNKQLWREGEPIELTIQEYDIVEYMYRHEGEIFEPQAIIENALNESYDPDDRKRTRLNTAMSRIIKKIEKDPNNRRYLHTVHGRGFQLTR